MTTPIKVFIVDDHCVVRTGFKAFFDQLDDITVVDEAADGDEALNRLCFLASTGSLPDVVLMDLLMPRFDGLAATAAISERYPQVRVVAVSSFVDQEKVQAALEAGAVGYVHKHAGPDEIAAAVRAVHRGRTYLDPDAAREVTRLVRWPGGPAAALTERERDVLACLAEGRSNREISRQLGISEPTVRTHVSNILAKLQVDTRTQAALWAVRESLTRGG